MSKGPPELYRVAQGTAHDSIPTWTSKPLPKEQLQSWSWCRKLVSKLLVGLAMFHYLERQEH